jgi:hypothetical protein
MSLRDKPHYSLSASELAEWLASQGTDKWWTVDGDPILTSRLAVPCPADELIRELTEIDRPLLVLARLDDAMAKGASIGPEKLDQLAGRLREQYSQPTTPETWGDDRFLVLSWQDSDNEWQLIEDLESTAQARADADSQIGN